MCFIDSDDWIEPDYLELLYFGTQTYGAKSFNTVRFYPDIAAWKKIDPKEEYEKYYNRYANW
ncbi:hypothetical protein EfmAA96_08830 [Enterococcus faecium]|nr:hypothetical protein EfmAA96_08830 [Enterococcus faecium]